MGDLICPKAQAASSRTNLLLCLRALAQVNSPEAQEILQSVKQTISIPNYSVSNLKDFSDESDFTTIQG